MIDVLLVCSVLREGIGKYFSREEQSYGGWIDGIINGLSTVEDIHFKYTVFEKANINNVEMHSVKGVDYYIVSYCNHEGIENYFTTICYDVCHLMGGEHSYIEDIMPFINYDKTLLYIQSFLSEYEKHYDANYNLFYRKIPFLYSPYNQLLKNDFKKRAKIETELISKVKYITGRTEWSEAVLFNLHFQGEYFHMNETLRSDFYNSGKWNINQIDKQTIYVSQASYSIKGGHMILEIVKILKSYYPNIKCYIAGTDLMKSQSLATKLGFSYASLIKKMIYEYDLVENIIFTGNLNCNEVIEHLLKCNAYLSASSIENSSNSLQEAMLLGVPSVSSFVGGTDTIVSNRNQCILYPFDDPVQAAYAISKIFMNDNIAQELSSNSVKRITELANPEKNASRMYEIYLAIASKNSN